MPLCYIYVVHLFLWFGLASTESINNGENGSAKNSSSSRKLLDGHHILGKGPVTKTRKDLNSLPYEEGFAMHYCLLDQSVLTWYDIGDDCMMARDRCWGHYLLQCSMNHIPKPKFIAKDLATGDITSILHIQNYQTMVVQNDSLIHFKYLRDLEIKLFGKNASLRIDAGALNDLLFLEGVSVASDIGAVDFSLEFLNQVFSLRFLSVSYNSQTVNVHNITHTLFRLPHLQQVCLKNVQTCELDWEKLPERDAMTSFVLENSGITSMPDISVMPNLQILNLENNGIKNVRFPQSTNQSQLLTVKLGSNPVEEISRADIATYRNISWLSLSLTNIPQITIMANAFFDLKTTKINYLSFERSPLSKVSYKNLFTSLKDINIVTLNLRKTTPQIEVFDVYFATSLFENRHLRSLDISWNLVDSIIADAFEKTPNLERLLLIDCSIRHLDKDAFRRLTALKELYLNGNPVIQQRALRGLARSLNEIQIGYYDTMTVVEFETTETDLYLPNLKSLGIGNSNFKLIKPDVYHPDKSTLVDPNKYFISITFLDTRHLQTISLRNIPNGGVNVQFKCTSDLRSLNFENANFSVGFFFAGKYKGNLTFPSLNRMIIKTADNSSLFRDKGFEHVLTGMPSLTTLEISDVTITSLPANFFQQTRKLKKITLTNNQIAYIPPRTFNDLKFLKDLNLVSNKIKSIDLSNMRGLPSLFSFFFEKNDFKCECELREFRDWVKNNSRKIVFHKEFCTSPKELRNKLITEFSVPWIECDNYKTMIIALSLVCFLALVVIVALVIAYNSLSLKYFFHRLKLKRNGYQTVPGNNGEEYDVFLCYSEKDLDWTINVLYARLQNKQLNVSLHHKTFLPGDTIADNIIRNIDCSKKIVFVITRNFLNSDWGIFELDMALGKLLHDRRARIIGIFLEKIPEKELPKKNLRHLYAVAGQ